MPQFIYTIRPTRPDMLTTGPTEAERTAIAAHLAYLQHGAVSGTVELAGRTETTGAETFGICIFAAADQAAAEAFSNADPAIASGVFKAETLPFRIAVRRS